MGTFTNTPSASWPTDRYPDRMPTTFQVTIDCADADVMASFWSTALGYEREQPPAGYDTWDAFFDSREAPRPPAGSIASIVDPTGDGPRIFFIRVPEPKTVKNRIHFDIMTDGTDAERDAKVAELVEAGAHEGERVEMGESTWHVMLDPEGNEFCIE